MGANQVTVLASLCKCTVCDTVVEVLDPLGLDLVCCGREMQPLSEQNDSQASAGHMPVVLVTPHGVRVRAGTGHPMNDDHRIEWIEVCHKGQCCRQFFDSGSVPDATFDVRANELLIRLYCSVHGLWSKTVRRDETLQQEALAALSPEA